MLRQRLCSCGLVLGPMKAGLGQVRVKAGLDFQVDLGRLRSNRSGVLGEQSFDNVDNFFHF